MGLILSIERMCDGDEDDNDADSDAGGAKDSDALTTEMPLTVGVV